MKGVSEGLHGRLSRQGGKHLMVGVGDSHSLGSMVPMLTVPDGISRERPPEPLELGKSREFAGVLRVGRLSELLGLGKFGESEEVLRLGRSTDSLELLRLDKRLLAPKVALVRAGGSVVDTDVLAGPSEVTTLPGDADAVTDDGAFEVVISADDDDSVDDVGVSDDSLDELEVVELEGGYIAVTVTDGGGHDSACRTLCFGEDQILLIRSVT